MSKTLFPYAINNNFSNVRNINEYSEFGFIENNTHYLDLSMGNCGCFTLGFKRNDLIEKVCNQMQDLPFCSGEFLTTNNHIQALANKLYSMSDGYRSIFSLSGSDAVEGAIRVTQLYHAGKNQQRNEIVGFDNSYHGSTYLSSSVGDTRDMHHLYGRDYKCQTISRTIADLDRDWSNTMCVVIESSSWQDGLKSISQDFWNKLRQICNDNDVVLIVDDIAMCGGKTGNFFGWKDNENNILIEPDIFTMGKGFTGGYFPLSATLVGEKVYGVVKDIPLVHGFTYSFSLSGIYSVLEYIDIIENENILKEHNKVKNNAESIFDTLIEKNLITDYTSHGLVFNLRLHNTNYYDNQDTIEQHFKMFGLSSGMWNEAGDGLLIIIPLNANHEYFEQLSSRLENSLKSYNSSYGAISN